MNPNTLQACDSNLRVDRQGAVAFVWLDRPAVRNALDGPLIAALAREVTMLGQDPGVRVIVLGGQGTTFCAGADLNWMARLGGLPAEANLADARALAGLFKTLHECPKPTVARVHGACYGGGIGLVAACDVAIACMGTGFSLSEVRVGLLPATIAPHVLRAIGVRAASQYMLSGKVFDGIEAARIGLVHEAVADDELDVAIERCVAALLAGAPGAQAAIKRLLRDVAGRELDDGLLQDTAGRIAEARASAEGREGLAAMLGKRRPNWFVDREAEAAADRAGSNHDLRP